MKELHYHLFGWMMRKTSLLMEESSTIAILVISKKQNANLKEKCGIKQYSEYTWGIFKSDFELYSGKINKFCRRKAISIEKPLLVITACNRFYFIARFQVLTGILAHSSFAKVSKTLKLYAFLSITCVFSSHFQMGCGLNSRLITLKC